MLFSLLHFCRLGAGTVQKGVGSGQVYDAVIAVETCVPPLTVKVAPTVKPWLLK